jgi:hypothetical protein
MESGVHRERSVLQGRDLGGPSKEVLDVNTTSKFDRGKSWRAVQVK